MCVMWEKRGEMRVRGRERDMERKEERGKEGERTNECPSCDSLMVNNPAHES